MEQKTTKEAQEINSFRREGNVLTHVRILNAPRELVWDVWTKPEHLANWWGPDGFTLTNKSIEVKPGGSWQFTMHGMGKDFPNKIVFIEVVRPERLIYKHTGDGDTKHIKFQVTITFGDMGNKTKLTMKSIFESAEVLDKLDKECGAIEGGKQHLNNLEKYLEAQKGEPFIIERIFNAPADMVWKAISDKNEMKKWYFDLAEFKPEVGFKFQFTGGPSPEKQFLHLCEITEAIPKSKLTYSWRYDGYEGISFVTFELFAEGNKTRLKLTHVGLETFPGIPEFRKENFAAGWTHIIGTALKEHLEKN